MYFGRIMTKTVKRILITGVLMVIYGFLCRGLNIDFFWESNVFGWVIIMVGLIFLLIRRVKVKKSTNGTTGLEKVGIGALILFIILMGLIIIVIDNSNALSAAKTYVLNSDSLKKEIGDIRGFGFTYTGGIEISSDSAGEDGTANISLIIKGSKKFKELDFYVVKEKKQNWVVKAIQ